MKKIIFILFFLIGCSASWAQLSADFEGYLTLVSREKNTNQIPYRDRYFFRGDSLRIMPLEGLAVELQFGGPLIYGKANRRFGLGVNGNVEIEYTPTNALDATPLVFENDSTKILDQWCYKFSQTKNTPFGKVQNTLWISPAFRHEYAPLFARTMDFRSTLFGNGELIGLPLRVETILTNGSLSILEVEEIVPTKLPPQMFSLPKGYKMKKE